MNAKFLPAALFAASLLTIGSALSKPGPNALQLKKTASDYQRCAMRAAIEAAKREKSDSAANQIHQACDTFAQKFQRQQVRYGIATADALKNSEALRRNTFRIVGAYLIVFAAVNSHPKGD